MDTVDIYKQLEKLSNIDLLLSTLILNEKSKKNEDLKIIYEDINKIFRILDNYNDMIGKTDYKVYKLENTLMIENTKLKEELFNMNETIKELQKQINNK